MLEMAQKGCNTSVLIANAKLHHSMKVSARYFQWGTTPESGEPGLGTKFCHNAIGRATLNSPRRPPKTASLTALLSSCSGQASLPQQLSQAGKARSVGEKKKKAACIGVPASKNTQMLQYSAAGFSGTVPRREAECISKSLQNQILWMHHLGGIKV